MPHRNLRVAFDYLAYTYATMYVRLYICVCVCLYVNIEFLFHLPRYLTAFTVFRYLI